MRAVLSFSAPASAGTFSVPANIASLSSSRTVMVGAESVDADVAIFATNDSTVASDPIGQFDLQNRETWPNRGRGISFIGIVGASSSVNIPNSVACPYAILLRVGSAEGDVEVLFSGESASSGR